MNIQSLLEHIPIILDLNEPNGQGKIIRSSLSVLNNSHFMFKN
ncbi:hypothetical protein JNE12002_46190 [Escherichia coli]|nr:hypothetical protein PPECC33_01591 [Escherichia coli PCN033]EIH14505.1 hypothetical protein EC990741_1548 [Escherichia coli 97.0259]KEJ77483.1 hypothetical protein AB67_1613 [Escherichia coli 5-366-08_S1_C3]KEL67205.1 hypothetical protein AB08_4301 [Escherichia coli 5-366-08_S1_C1]RCH09689.1 hypothetical protein CSC37_0723 [Escherichia coli]